MPDTYAIDSNVYIRALRNVAQLGELQGFLKLFGRRVGLAGVVSMELRAGASTPAHVEAVESLVGAYFQRNRMIAASAAGHREAGRVLAALVEHEGVVLAQAPRSLTADVLLAVCCREHDVVLITDNHRDFVPIQRHLRGFRCIAPWPAAPRLHR